jgi:hypothetical protein
LISCCGRGLIPRSICWRGGTNRRAADWYSKQKTGSLYRTRRSASKAPRARSWRRTYRENGCYQREPQGAAKMEGGKGRKGRAAHHKDACMLREAGGGPGRPNFAGDRRGRRGCGRCCNRCQLDCFICDVLGGGAELLGPFAWLEDDHGVGATARW